ncbi:septum formation inhibitor Maf [Croceitalea rosinachiae]|uniref:Septum formation inhibitor Maf n=1 Tax=Croceitalea rosinachiae TaxID=3075596 RepID=A0ABU3ABQ6_9FLAO|nr:septum formation inhibitor Maf [Croceitalea sp. F388]MDT0607338.1 septum formation inhibitor Maf [Croceitalea sp. F388]
MKKWLRFELIIVLFAVLISLFESCKEQTAPEVEELAINTKVVNTETSVSKNPLSQEFKKYWYAGNAEITSYKLEQARYGEVREGTSVLIYVTEPFLPEIQVKADRSNSDNIPVLKLNATKNYLTGIYPYSIMSSTFYPVYDNQHAIKTSLSIQEWCGHVYSQLNNREKFEFTSHSYFEGEADKNLTLDKAFLENEIWTKIRINPENLPIGEIQIVPSLEFFRVKHQEIQALNAIASLETSNGTSTYTVDYGDGIRKVSINFTSAFPYTIESWSEEFKSGYGSNSKLMTSKGIKLKSLKTPYWRQNSNKDSFLRDSLGI